jgi:hypothetical protein
MTNEVAQLRDRATRLLEMALRARSRGNADHADELTDMANEALAQAEAIEREATIPPSNAPEQSVGQQQQQPQSKDESN